MKFIKILKDLILSSSHVLKLRISCKLYNYLINNWKRYQKILQWKDRRKSLTLRITNFKSAQEGTLIISHSCRKSSLKSLKMLNYTPSGKPYRFVQDWESVFRDLISRKWQQLKHSLLSPNKERETKDHLRRKLRWLSK